jgi:hypothetical protein
MINKKWIWILPLAVMFFIVFSPIAYGDLYWVNLVVSGVEPDFLAKNMPKQVREQMLKEFKSTTETESCFLTSYGFRSEAKDHIVIIEYDTMIMYQLNPLEKIKMNQRRAQRKKILLTMTLMHEVQGRSI